jgi:uncharacterized protein (DUF305 family)
MRITWRLAIISVLLCALPMKGQQHGFQKHAGNKLAIEPYWSKLKASMEKMHVAMASIETSGKSDVDFVRLMLPHHQAAIDMAKTQLLYGNDPQMRRLAQEIITDQASEIELMNLWLKQHDVRSPDVSQTPKEH